ncbi:hypothetical protein LSAT2_015032, partial [Lamellibrachia satsuma]
MAAISGRSVDGDRRWQIAASLRGVPARSHRQGPPTDVRATLAPPSVYTMLKGVVVFGSCDRHVVRKALAGCWNRPGRPRSHVMTHGDASPALLICLFSSSPTTRHRAQNKQTRHSLGFNRRSAETTVVGLDAETTVVGLDAETTLVDLDAETTVVGLDAETTV